MLASVAVRGLLRHWGECGCVPHEGGGPAAPAAYLTLPVRCWLDHIQQAVASSTAFVGHTWPRSWLPLPRSLHATCSRAHETGLPPHLRGGCQMAGVSMAPPGWNQIGNESALPGWRQAGRLFPPLGLAHTLCVGGGGVWGCGGSCGGGSTITPRAPKACGLSYVLQRSNGVRFVKRVSCQQTVERTKIGACKSELSSMEGRGRASN